MNALVITEHVLVADMANEKWEAEGRDGEKVRDCYNLPEKSISRHEVSLRGRLRVNLFFPSPCPLFSLFLWGLGRRENIDDGDSGRAEIAVQVRNGLTPCLRGDVSQAGMRRMK